MGALKDTWHLCFWNPGYGPVYPPVPKLEKTATENCHKNADKHGAADRCSWTGSCESAYNNNPWSTIFLWSIQKLTAPHCCTDWKWRLSDKYVTCFKLVMSQPLPLNSSFHPHSHFPKANTFPRNPLQHFPFYPSILLFLTPKLTSTAFTPFTVLLHAFLSSHLYLFLNTYLYLPFFLSVPLPHSCSPMDSQSLLFWLAAHASELIYHCFFFFQKVTAVCLQLGSFPVVSHIPSWQVRAKQQQYIPDII